MKKKSHGGTRSSAGRKPEPGQQILIKARILSDEEKTFILSLTPRERVEAMMERAKQTQ